MEVQEEVVQEEQFNTGKDEYLSIMFSRWQKFHIATMFIALLFSVLGFLTFMSFKGKFSPHCPLGAEIRIGRKKTNGRQVIDVNQTQWGDAVVCQFVIFTPVAQLLVALTGLLLFCTQSGQSNLRGGLRHNSQLKLVPPTSMLGFIVAGLSLSAAMLLTFGGSDFCRSVENQLESCSSVDKLHWKKKSTLHNFQLHLKSSQACYWLTTHAFFTHSVMTLLRWITNVDNVIVEERELRENPNFHDIILRDMEEDKDTLRSVSLYAKQK